MSRFFVSGYTSDSSSSEEEDLLSSSEEELISSSEELSDDSEFDNDESDSDDSDSDYDGKRPSGPAYFLKKSFLKGGAQDSDSDSDDEGRKVVKSAKDKLLDDMKESIESINVAKRSNTWSTVLTDFEKLGRLLVKSKQQNFGTPKFYIVCLGGLEDYIDATNENEKSEKTLNGAEARAFNTVRQRVKKTIKEYQVYYDQFRENPESYGSDEPIDIRASVPATESEDFSGTTKVLSPVFALLKLISETRGKKNVDKFEQVQQLEDALSVASKDPKPFELISIYTMLLSIRFDISLNQNYMTHEQWQKYADDLEKFLDVLEGASDKYQLTELARPTDDIDIEPEANENGVKLLFGSITSLIERLDDEFTKALQNIDPHSTEYIERLKDESEIYKLIVRGQIYVESITSQEKKGNYHQLSRIILRRLEHIYYKPDQLIVANEKNAWKDISADSIIASKTSTPSELVDALSDHLLKNKNKVYAQQALLYSIYYYSVNGGYDVARELFLKSQAYAAIHLAESSVQIHYNRALVQLGLSAFRNGNIEESHQILNEISNSQRVKELLGQGFSTKYPSQASVVEKQRLLPFHMHINLELLECVYMTSSLLIEIPALALAAINPKDSKKKASLKSFKSKLEFHDRQYFTGPPESIKDHIIYASRALQKGDWAKAYELLSSIKIWKLLPDNENLLTMMKSQLQVEGLRTYIFTYKSIYVKLAVSKLSELFALSNEQVVEILEKMFSSGDVSGAIDESKQYVNFVSEEPQRSRLQELAITMKEKVVMLSEKNERTASNGHARKQNAAQQQQQQQQKDQRDQQQEDNNRFRYASVNTNNDEFQVTA